MNKSYDMKQLCNLPCCLVLNSGDRQKAFTLKEESTHLNIGFREIKQL